MDNIAQIMSKEIIVVDANETIYKASHLMKEYDIGFLPVVEGDSLVGVVTDRDIIIKGIAEKVNMEEEVAKIMTNECIAVEPETSLEEAMEIMAEHQIRRLCVIEGNEVVGICAIGDIARHNRWLEETGETLSEISIPTSRRKIMAH